MLFKSRHAAMVFKVRSAIPRFNAMGEIIATRPSIRAEFGQFGAEQAVHNPLTGSTEMFAEVVGHFFDTDLWYEQRLGDTVDPAEVERCTEEKAYLEAVLFRKCRDVPEFIERIEKARVPAPKPWASYDGQQAADVVAAAACLLGAGGVGVRAGERAARRRARAARGGTHRRRRGPCGAADRV